ncbi:hypothetical protein DFH08DRAFT_880807 [Mycena albidolilacea]|uniref:Uncharacterized protein n=1 Tax=Mycena albidolilacea TaxID=1033008 RepID=A0AAD6ZR91_9AGAR|nr:hypothetical protein DFH08DRAFT_880807 [Mycena albidolilacea]
MIPTAVARSRFKGRRPLQSFMANKDYYKGNRQSSLPGHRTGAPGVHVNERPGYKLLESRVRVFVAPRIDEILGSSLKPYVPADTPVPWGAKHGVFARMPAEGLTPAHFLKAARKYSAAKEAARRPKPKEVEANTEAVTGTESKAETPADVVALPAPAAAPTPTPAAAA